MNFLYLLSKAINKLISNDFSQSAINSVPVNVVINNIGSNVNPLSMPQLDHYADDDHDNDDAPQLNLRQFISLKLICIGSGN